MTGPTIAVIGENAVRLWGLTSRERARRIAREAKLQWAEDPAAETDGALVLINAAHVFDPLWLRHCVATPGFVLTVSNIPVMAHCVTDDQCETVIAAMRQHAPVSEAHDLTMVDFASGFELENKQLRKRTTPFANLLTLGNIPALERASYFGAYKGVTDILTKYLWPEWALVLTRIAARFGISPNQVTAVGAVLCVLATYLFWQGEYWWGMASALVFMVLDTVDGKLARCTITSSWWGNIFDHGIDLVHPPFWWWAWGVGLGSWGLALSGRDFALVMIAIVGGYGVQRLIEGVFMRRNEMMHIHVWEPIDTKFRLIASRRNPNMVILFFATLFGRPDIGLILVAIWTLLTCAFHMVRLAQAELARSRGRAIRSWMDQPA